MAFINQMTNEKLSNQMGNTMKIYFVYVFIR